MKEEGILRAGGQVGLHWKTILFSLSVAFKSSFEQYVQLCSSALRTPAVLLARSITNRSHHNNLSYTTTIYCMFIASKEAILFSLEFKTLAPGTVLCNNYIFIL